MSDIPSSGWCTDWSAYNTPRLWSMVAGEDNPEAWKQVIAWREVSDAVDSHLARLAQARETLEAAWPTSQSEASRAFVTRLNTLVARMEGAREEASSTSMALDNILQALRQAKQNIEPLWQQYRDKNEDVVPAWWDNAEEKLDAQARAHMIAAEQVVEQYVPSIKVPIPYRFTPPRRREGDEIEIGPEEPSSQSPGSGPSTATVPHDPPPALSGVGSTPSNFSHSSGRVGGLTPSDVGVIKPGGPDSSVAPPFDPGSSVVRPSPGPELSELPQPSKILPPAIQPGHFPSSGPHGFVPPAGSAFPAPLLPPIFSGDGSTRTGLTPKGSFPAASGRSVTSMPSGAVIGETPFGKFGPKAPTGEGVASKSGLPKWLPSAGQAEPGGMGAPGIANRGRNSSEDGEKRFDPDNPWSVAQGVEPVIEPSRKVSIHDPGSGVIGRY